MRLWRIPIRYRQEILRLLAPRRLVDGHIEIFLDGIVVQPQPLVIVRVNRVDNESTFGAAHENWHKLAEFIVLQQIEHLFGRPEGRVVPCEILLAVQDVLQLVISRNR